MRSAVVQLRSKATDGAGFRQLRGGAQLEANELRVLPGSRRRMMPGPDRIPQQPNSAPARQRNTNTRHGFVIGMSVMLEGRDQGRIRRQSCFDRPFDERLVLIN